MYSTCLFCNSRLPANEAVEHFPAGRRIAFDGGRGRLWAVCARCGRWNLSPLETRWEAIDECERRFRDTRVRVSTENVGLARLGDGTELVRVGRPMRPELAAWRYGDRFGGRRKRAWLTAGVVGGAGAVAGGVAAAAAGLAVVGIPVVVAGLPLLAAAEAVRRSLPRALSPAEARGAQLLLRDGAGVPMLDAEREFVRARMRFGPEHPRGWALALMSVRGLNDSSPFRFDDPRDHLLTGPAAVRALAVLLARPNALGAGRGEVRAAVARIERAGAPERYFARAERDARALGWGYREVWEMPGEIRLALEMAAHEEAERRALEGELAELERQWRDAEEIAAVADRLAIPADVERRLDAGRGAGPDA